MKTKEKRPKAMVDNNKWSEIIEIEVLEEIGSGAKKIFFQTHRFQVYHGTQSKKKCK